MLCSRQLFTCQHRLLSTVKPKYIKNRKHNLIELNPTLKSLPKVITKPTNSSKNLYILSKSLSAIVIKHLSQDLRNETAFVFEINPGPGILTHGILEAGISKLRVFEKEKGFLPRLTALKKLHNNKLEIDENDFLNLPKIEAALRHKSLTLQDTVFKDVKSKAWIEEPPLKIFAVIPSSRENFLRYILRKYAYFESIFSFGRVELLLFVSDREFAHITAQPEDKYRKYTAISVLYQILFYVEILHKEPRSSFYPQQITESDNPSHMHLVRLTPKRHLLDVIAPDRLHELTQFVRHTYMQRKRLVAESLDHWITGSSDRLKAEGINPRVEFGHLTPCQALTLFLYFSSWPEYDTCLFQNVVSKMGEDEGLVIHSDESDKED